MTVDFSEQVGKAREALGAGDPRAAFTALRWVFRLPELPTQREELAEALSLFSQLALPIAGPELAGVVDRGVAGLDAPQALYDLGYQLIEQRLPELAACVLSRATTLAPGQEALVTELCAALEQDGQR